MTEAVDRFSVDFVTIRCNSGSIIPGTKRAKSVQRVRRILRTSYNVTTHIAIRSAVLAFVAVRVFPVTGLDATLPLKLGHGASAVQIQSTGRPVRAA